MSDPAVITVSTVVKAPLETVWVAWTQPEHIRAWNFASDDWACPEARNDLRIGGTFAYMMAARDGSAQFEFGGEYTEVQAFERIAYRLGDGRRVLVRFERVSAGETRVTEAFEVEQVHSEDMQRAGWQAILENFRRHAESLPVTHGAQ